MDGFLPTAELDDDVWDRILAVNLTAVMRLTRAALPSMITAGKGSIVNVSLEAGLRGSAAGTAYTTSKHAVNGFTVSTAFFYAPAGVRCNAVAPGAVATSIEAPFRSQYGGGPARPVPADECPADRDGAAARGGDHLAPQRRLGERDWCDPPLRWRLVSYLRPRWNMSALPD